MNTFESTKPFAVIKITPRSGIIPTDITCTDNKELKELVTFVQNSEEFVEYTNSYVKNENENDSKKFTFITNMSYEDFKNNNMFKEGKYLLVDTNKSFGRIFYIEKKSETSVGYIWNSAYEHINVIVSWELYVNKIVRQIEVAQSNSEDDKKENDQENDQEKTTNNTNSDVNESEKDKDTLQSNSTEYKKNDICNDKENNSLSTDTENKNIQPVSNDDKNKVTDQINPNGCKTQ